MRTFFAIIACFVLVIIWNIFCTSMGWRFQGGAIPASIFYTGLLFVWQAIRGTGFFKKKSAIQADDSSRSFSGKSDSDALGPEKTTPDGDEPERISLSSPSISETMTEPIKYRQPSISLIPAEVPAELPGYELLAAEKEKGYRHEALWLKCHSEVDGDQTKAESAYNRARAQILGDELKASKSNETAQKLKAARAKVRERAVSGFRLFAYIILNLVFGALAFLSAVAGVMLLTEPVGIVPSVVMIVAAFLFGLAAYKCKKAAQRWSGA